MRGFRRGLMLLATGTMLAAGPARAQPDEPKLDDAPATRSLPARLPPGAVVQPLEDGAGAELRRNLTTLADNPRSLSALIGAGRAALDMGDGEAALSFFARAEEIAPRDARVKAGMASALVHMERGETALTLFAEAEALGAPAAEIARDRGLAYDMVGDPRRAQQDYALALRRGDDPELRRRMALSLAISGQRDAALRMIDDQLRRHDRAGWRTQAFVLALTGDAAGANDTAQRMMPAGAAQSMAPFFARLASLNPAQKAMAVHFGHFPSDGRATAGVRTVDTSADPGAIALAQSGEPRPRYPLAEPLSRDPRRRPDAAASPIDRAAVGRRPAQDDARLAPPARRPAEIAQADARRADPPPQPLVVQPQSEPEPARFEPDAPIMTTPQEQAPIVTALPEQAPLSQPAVTIAEARSLIDAAMPGFTLIPAGEQPRLPAAQTPPPGSSAPDFGQIAALVASLPAEEEARPAATRETPPPVRAARAEPRPAAARPARTAEQRGRNARPAPPANPSRHWVQIAGGANRAAMPREFTRLRGLAPALLGSRTAYTTPLNATNRLLVGPFDTPRTAQAFVNELSERNVAAFAWTSPAGQEIERLQIRR